jgi:hypothetical protein
MPAWGISLVVNLSILAAFHFIVFEQSRPPEVNTIISDVEDSLNEEKFHFSDRVTEDQVGNGGTSGALTPTMKSATAVGTNDVPLKEQVKEIVNPEVPQLSEASLVKLEGDVTKLVSIKGQSDNAVGGVEGAMDRIAFEIRQSLKERKTLVLWLFDASGSLNKRRTAIAERFDNIYKQLGKTGTTDGLYSVVVSYGEKAQVLTPEPIQDVKRLSEIVHKEIKEDKSGKENVFGTVKMTLDKFQTWHRQEGPWNKVMFIVTDERGDDAEQYLEDDITLAKRSRTRIYAIGNAAVFGRQEGYVKWTFDDGYTENIKVDQGPESAFPDAVQLPFFGSQHDWKLRQMSAAYGPYALTRLCAETGGLYLMLPEESQGYAFDRAIMRRYAPDYRPIRVLEQEIAKNPAKAALVSAARMTFDSDLPTPQLEFRAYSDNILRTELREAQKPVADAEFKLRRMFEAIKAGESARDTLKDERWQAAFDLAIGRVLAMRVRYFGYQQMLGNMTTSPKSFTNDKDNMWRLAPAKMVESGPEMRKAAEQANMYLKRVIDQHPGTPWALLAERELQNELGWTWQEYSEPIPGTNQLKGSDEEVARLLLAEEERKTEARKKMQAKKRDIPKL